VETPTDRNQTPQGETGSPRVAAGPAICDPGHHASGPWCSRCGQWFVDGIWRNTPPETTQLAAPLAMALGLTPADEPRSPWRRMVNVIDLDGDLITALGDLTDRYGVAGVRKAMGILWPLEPVKLAAGGFVNGPNPVLVGEKDGPFIPMLPPGLEEAIEAGVADGSIFSESSRDPADVHSDDTMLSAVVSEEVTPLTPVAEEIRVVLNRYSAEAPSGTPDYILANYLIDCLKAFNEAVSLRAVWRGEPIEQTTLHIDKER
jgi:hypothetical protein